MLIITPMVLASVCWELGSIVHMKMKKLLINNTCAHAIPP